MRADAPLVVFGTGALACALGARLARAGTPVMLSGSWEAGLRACTARGIVVHEPGGSWCARVGVCRLGAAMDAAGTVLVLVKSHRTAAVAPFVARALAPSGLVVTLQNGLGNREALEREVGVGRVAAGVAVMGATLLEPGVVRVVPGRLALGTTPAQEVLLRGFAEQLQRAGLEVELTPDVDRMVWRKLVANCAINPLTALAGVANGALLEDPGQRHTLVGAAREVQAVARAKGIEIGMDAGALAEQVAAATATNRSSMLQDVERGAHTEIDALNGAVVEEGRRLGVPTPVNEDLWRRVRDREGWA